MQPALGNPYNFEILVGYNGKYEFDIKGIPTEISKKIYGLTEALIKGKCSAICNDPLAVFGACCDVDSNLLQYKGYKTLFQDIAMNLQNLTFIASNPSMIYEKSFSTSQLDESNGPKNPAFNYLFDTARQITYSAVVGGKKVNISDTNKYRIFRGSYRSVIISNDFNPIPLDWQCEYGENAVLLDSPTKLTGSVGQVGNFTCKRCRRDTRLWWWKNGAEWIKISNLERIRIGQGIFYVAQCEE